MPPTNSMIAMVLPGEYRMAGTSGQYPVPDAVPVLVVEPVLVLDPVLVELELEPNPVGQYEDALDGTENE